MKEAKKNPTKKEIVHNLIFEIVSKVHKISIDECISRIGNVTAEVLESTFCSIFAWDDHEEAYPLAMMGNDPAFTENLESKWIQKMVFTLRNIEGTFSSSRKNQPNVLEDIEEIPSRSILSCPVILFGDLLGLLVVVREHSKDFVEQEIEILQSLTNVLSITIPNIYNNSLVELAEICIRFLDEKDPYTHGHSLRVMKYADMLAREYGLPFYTRRELKICALLHDIGKVIIKDSILSKPGKLTDYEFKIMQMHPQIGANITEKIGKKFSEKILSHHERWDGKGYPNQYKGKKIPLISRIIAIADTFDAITSRRSYRDKVSSQKAVAEIVKYSGSQFDPDLVECLMKAHKEDRFQVIYA